MFCDYFFYDKFCLLCSQGQFTITNSTLNKVEEFSLRVVTCTYKTALSISMRVPKEKYNNLRMYDFHSDLGLSYWLFIPKELSFKSSKRVHPCI